LFDHVLDNVFLLCLECRPDIVLDRFWCRGKFFSSDAFFRDRAVLGRGVTSSRCYILYTAAARRAPLTPFEVPGMAVLFVCSGREIGRGAPFEAVAAASEQAVAVHGFPAMAWRVCVFIDQTIAGRNFFSLQGKKDTGFLLSLAAWARP
jgi:hypothetical protein